MKKHAFRIGLVVTMLLGLMMISANAADCACGGAHDHDGWTPITQANAQALLGDAQNLTGNTKYYLTEDVSVTNTVAAGSTAATKRLVGLQSYTLDICLCGHKLDYNVTDKKDYGIFYLSGKGATLNIHDCGDTAGSINYVTETKKAVKLAVVKSTDTVNLYGGDITGFFASTGVIQVQGGTVNMFGGKVSNITHDATNGFIYLLNANGKVNISGGEIDTSPALNAKSGLTGLEVTISGGTFGEIANLDRYNTLTITGGTFSHNVTAAEGYVSYDNEDGTWTVYAEADVPTGGGGSTTGPVALTAELAANALAAGDYYLSGALALSTTLTIPADVEVNLDLKGNTLTSSVSPAVKVEGTLNLSDSVGGGAIKPATDTTSQGITVTGTLNMTGGAIDGFNNGSGNVAGVNVSGGTFNMSGGAIKNCKATGNGVAIQIASAGGTVEITGGEVSDNEGKNTFYLNGGGNFTVKGGSIYGNTTTRCIHNQKATVTVEGGNFGLKADGTVAANTGSVFYVNRNGSTTISGGSFYFGEDADDLVYKGYTTGCDVQITGGDMSAFVGRGSLADGYFCYKLAAIADSNTPYRVNKAIGTTLVELKVSGTNGFYVRFSFGSNSVYKLTNTDNFTITCEGGSIKQTLEKTVDCWIATKDMFNDVTLTIENGGHDAYTATFSVKDYAEELLADADSSESLKKALSDMLRYGDAAQAYFYEGTADKAATVTGLVDGSSWTIADSSELSADVAQLYQGSSLSLKNDINMNLYFAGNVTDVTVNGATVNLTETENGLKVASVDLDLQNVADRLEIAITAEGSDPITIYDSIQAYAYRAQNLAVKNSNLTNLCTAMMNFVLSANEHFGV